MTLSDLRYSLILLSLLAVAAGCKNGPVDEREVVVINPSDGGVMGCVQPSLPGDYPDLFVLAPPRFPTDDPNGQAQVDPGDPIDAEIPVNSATRQVFVELRDGFEPDVLIYATDLDTPGNEVISLVLLPQTQRIGRYYMKITLCGVDCDEREVVFDANPDITLRYERTLIEDGEIVQVDRTCLDFTADPGIGSGTIVIQ
ncbi:MAG: hypothetical protein OES69_07665 [Myxococcales bacterium]|nr:hypothetical protein [Myxococcales bacterium]MDH3843800.1 hypothetical protein [Myxococcales bacterium]